MPSLLAPLALLVLLASCSGCRDEDAARAGVEKAVQLAQVDDVMDPPVSEPQGVLGGACEVDGDCLGEGAVCLSDGFPRGSCALPCEGTCPAEEGRPTAFCAASHQLPDEVQWIGDAACLASCDYGAFEKTGCRQGYGCVPLEQGGGPTEVRYACLPGVGVELDGARKELASLGVSFSPVESPNEAPRGMPNTVCGVKDAVELHSPLFGLELESVVGGEGGTVLASAEMALALADAAPGLRQLGVKKLLHMGTYNCRPIRGTTQLSRHGHANAIDVFGVETDDGKRYTVKKHWRKKPVSEGAKLMASVVEKLVASGRWKVVLTPAYNKDHEDHLHLDLVTGPADPAAFLKRWPKSLSD